MHSVMPRQEPAGALSGQQRPRWRKSVSMCSNGNGNGNGDRAAWAGWPISLWHNDPTASCRKLLQEPCSDHSC